MLRDVVLQALAPTYEKLAKRFAKIDSVVIAKMDGTENEHPEVEAQVSPDSMLEHNGSVLLRSLPLFWWSQERAPRGGGPGALRNKLAFDHYFCS